MRWRRRGLGEWGTGLNAEKIGVVVVKSCDIQIELRLYQAAIPSLVADQVFGSKFSVPDDAVESQRIGHKQSGDLKVFLDPRRGANGSGDGAPEGLPRVRCPQDTCARLGFEPGVIIVQELRSDG